MLSYAVSPFQHKVLEMPETADLFLGGGRGGGKSWAIAFLILRHVETYKSDARCLYIRQTYPGLQDFEAITRQLFTIADSKARYNSTNHVWRFSNGATVELGQLANDADFFKYQGRSQTALFIDEAGQYKDLRLIDMLRSNLRGPKNVPLRMVIAANPGGACHGELAKRYVLGKPSWQIFCDAVADRKAICCPSTYLDNENIDRDEYAKQLSSSTAGDPELWKAWAKGDWAIARGSFFASVLDTERNKVEGWESLPHSLLVARLKWGEVETRDANPWRLFLSFDYGVSAPSVCYAVAESYGAYGPDERFYPRGSLVLVDELAIVDRLHNNKGLGYTIPRQAEEIKSFCARWNIRPRGVADDACFSKQGHSAGSIANEFKREGVYFKPAEKGGRVAGWERMRRLLADAGKPDVPGLYISDRCAYAWETLPSLPRDPRRMDDVDSGAADHAADAIRYACIRQKRTGRAVPQSRVY